MEKAEGSGGAPFTEGLVQHGWAVANHDPGSGMIEECLSGDGGWTAEFAQVESAGTRVASTDENQSGE
jgi:hypothetical protein